MSPLIALMKDQVRAMKENGMSAVYVGDLRDDDAIAEVCTGKNQVVYMSPESLLTMEGYAFRPRVPGASGDRRSSLYEKVVCVIEQ